MQTRHAIIDERHNEIHLPELPELLSEECRCDLCAHWEISLEFPVYAKVGGKHVRMGQCLGAENHPCGPYAEVQGPNEAAVFTSGDNRCRAFTASSDAQQDIESEVKERRLWSAA